MSESGCDTSDIPLLPFQQALDTLLEAARPVTEIEQVSLKQGLDRVLAEDMTSKLNVPPQANSAMDGYAINSTQLNGPAPWTLSVSQRIAAGEQGKPLAAGTAARIFTGAPIPDSADAVIMQEQVEVDADHITLSAAVNAGQNIRAAGEDIIRDQVILRRGDTLRAQELGLAASIGHPELRVFRKIRVAVFFTGDELVEPGQPLKPGQIYDSNRYTLSGLLQTLGCEVIDLGLVGDTLEQTRQALLSASAQADLVITSGGVSVGEEDHVRIALEQLGELRMWRLKIKPGKPFVYGQVNDAAFIGLPGNPVSVYATFCVFVAPFIKKLQGRTKLTPHRFRVRAAFDWLKPDTRMEFARARLIFDNSLPVQAEIYPNQSSGVLMSTSWADGYVVIPENTPVHKGDELEYFSFNEIL